MAYEAKTWECGECITDDSLNHMENGIAQVSAQVDSISTRVATAENDIDVLDARMDTFASLPDGSTTGDAELIDIRVGVDGTVYPSAGDAVRGQVSDLKSDLSVLYKQLSTADIWEVGSFQTSTGNASSSTTRLRTKGYIDKTCRILEIASGYWVACYCYDEFGVYQGVWDGTTFSKSVLTKFKNSVNINAIRGYNVRLLMEANTPVTISTSEGTNVTLMFPTDTTLSESGKPADAKVTGDLLSPVSGLVTGQENLNRAVFVYDFIEKTLANISTKLADFSASASGTDIALSASSSYDTYYFFASNDTKLYADATDVAYVAITTGTNPSSDGIVWSSQSAGILDCDSASRVRKSEGNLPTRDNPIILSKGSAIFITVTKDKTVPVYLYENTGVPKEVTADGGVYVGVGANQITLQGANYTVIFSKLTTTQGYQWNITSLAGKDGDMFPTGVDIVGVIQFVGASNFMGGAHGNESNYEFRVMSEGDDIADTDVYNEVHIIMNSHLYDPDHATNNVVDRFVEFVFTQEGWTCRNTFKILTTAQVQVAYPSGLFAFTASDCDGAYTNVGTVNLESTASRQLESTAFKEITINLTDNFTVNISSETADKGWVTYRSNTQSFKVYFANGELQNVVSGDIITGKCTYRF